LRRRYVSALFVVCLLLQYFFFCLEFLFGLALVSFSALACETSTTTFSRASTNVTNVVISADVDLFVQLVEASSFELSTTFYGLNSAISVCSESYAEDSATWRLHVGASASEPSSSVNSQIFFSTAHHQSVAMFCLPTLALYRAVNGQCTETATVTFSAVVGWSVTDESSRQVTVSYFGPKAYGYVLSLTIPDETVFSWSADDEALLIANLIFFYNDPNLSFSVLSHADVSGNLVILVNVLGFSTSTSATTSHGLISSGGLQLSDSAFSSVTATASTPEISCSIGYSTTDSSDICSDTDACLAATCSDEGDTAAICFDAVAPEVGWSCNCTSGWEDNSGTCHRVPCANPSQTNYVIASGTSVFESIRMVSCATGYTGTATDILCQADGTWTSSMGCTIVSCGTPVAGAGYSLGSGSTTYGASYSMTCATGYAGTAAALTCQSSGVWTAQSGCTIVSCPSTPTQTGYTIATGASTFGATRTVTCATGYSGTASVISCSSSASWTASSGCTIVSCSSSPSQNGFTFSSGASTYGSSRTSTCANGLIGSGSAISCLSSGQWSISTGCVNYINNGDFSGGLNAGTGGGGADNPLNTVVAFSNPGASGYVVRSTAVGGNSWTEYQMDLTTELRPSTTYVMSVLYFHDANWDGTRACFHARAFSASGNHVATGSNCGTTISTSTVGGNTWTYAYQTITTPSDYSNNFNWYLGYPSQNTAGYRYFTNIQIEPGSYPNPFVQQRGNCRTLYEIGFRTSGMFNSIFCDSNGNSCETYPVYCWFDTTNRWGGAGGWTLIGYYAKNQSPIALHTSFSAPSAWPNTDFPSVSFLVPTTKSLTQGGYTLMREGTSCSGSSISDVTSSCRYVYSSSTMSATDFYNVRVFCVRWILAEF
jgi:hypothetical protein